MNVAADAVSSGNPWLIIAGIAATILVAIIAARGPVWLEKTKARFGKYKETPKQISSVGEAILREWLQATRSERDKALKDVARLQRKSIEDTVKYQKRIDVLETELYRRGWDGRL